MFFLDGSGCVCSSAWYLQINPLIAGWSLRRFLEYGLVHWAHHIFSGPDLSGTWESAPIRRGHPILIVECLVVKLHTLAEIYLTIGHLHLRISCGWRLRMDEIWRVISTILFWSNTRCRGGDHIRHSAVCLRHERALIYRAFARNSDVFLIDSSLTT